MTTARLIDEANRLAFLGLYLDSWEVLESLPPADQLDSAAMAVRLKACTELGCWELGQDVARGMVPCDTPCQRQAVGRFHLAHAIALCHSGEVAAARAAILALTRVWPEGRAEALDCSLLAVVW